MSNSNTQNEDKAMDKDAAKEELLNEEGGTDTVEEQSATDDASQEVTDAQPVDEKPETLEEKVERLENGLLRAKADYQNLERNSARQKSEAIRFANAGLISALLPVIDDFERSIAAAGESEGESSALLDGVKLVYQNLDKALKDNGLTIIEAEGKPFDPQVHEAMMQQPSADHPEGTVLTEISKGYQLFDRVLRPSRVVVSKAVEGSSASDQEASDE